MARFDLDQFIASEFDEHEAVLRDCRKTLAGEFRKLVAVAVACLKGGGKILFFGNGGSAADAQHLATELTVRYVKDRAPIAAIALTTDTSALTAIGNDLGFEQLFARQIEALGRRGDLAIGITTSGRSPNVVKALETARTIGITAAAFTGGDGGKVKAIADPCLVVPSRTTARIQEMHILIGQMLCGAVERELGLVSA
jgi:D-sedoheptulose 7-phosphate isomerase